MRGEIRRTQSGGLPSWRRQFVTPATRAQRIFDALAGILLPAACLCADTIFFQGPHAVFREFRSKAYILSAFEMAILVLSWFSDGRPKLLAGLLWGPLAAGACFGSIVGVAILPWSIGGLVFFMGILGFSPFLCTFVYGRGAVRAYRSARLRLRPAAFLLSTVLGLQAAFLCPYLADRVAHRLAAEATDTVIHGDEVSADAALRRLCWIGWAAGPKEIGKLWADPGPEGPRKERMLRAVGLIEWGGAFPW